MTFYNVYANIKLYKLIANNKNMTEKNTRSPEIEETVDYPFGYGELMALSDEELVAISREFGEYYSGLLDPSRPPSEVDRHIKNLSLERAGLDARQVTADVVAAQAHAHEALRGVSDTRKVPPDFQGTVETGPLGIPVIISGMRQTEQVFGERSAASFCASDYMIERGKYPVVFTAETEGPRRDEAIRHELSHAIYALLRHAQVLPGGAQEYRGIKAVTLLAKDEAIAQMAAGQNKTTHPNVVRALRHMYGDDSDIVRRYRDNLRDAFNKDKLTGTDITMQDGILLAAAATTIEELVEGLERLSTIAQARRRNDSADALVSSERPGWGAV